MMNMKRNITCALCVFLLSGCRCGQLGREMGHAIAPTLAVAISCDLYHSLNGRWPDSQEELATFCAEERKKYCVQPESDCFYLDIPADIELTLQELPNGDLEVSFNPLEGAGSLTMGPLVLSKPSESAEVVP